MDDLLHSVIDTAHSRFPVYGERENIIGILMAKTCSRSGRPNSHPALQAPVFVPEIRASMTCCVIFAATAITWLSSS